MKVAIKWLDSELNSCEVTGVQRYGFLWRKKRFIKASLKRERYWFHTATELYADDYLSWNGHLTRLDTFLDQEKKKEIDKRNSALNWKISERPGNLPEARLLKG